MQVIDIISKKRDGKVLSAAEITELINGYVTGQVPDYQMAAWLMAVYFQGMTGEETANLTRAMAYSGELLDLSAVPGIKVDKHSTGGVADTTTLVLAPLVAAAGVPVAKMSGRGLGFTGGTIDKLEAIPGFNTALAREQFVANLLRCKLAITGQTATIAPADRLLYALRDVTGTVASIPLIAASIMSKKIAGGADKILLDVKVGSGAFMPDLAAAIRLSQTMVNIGQLVNRETRAVITNMNEPLGNAIGNSLEVLEALDILEGRGPLPLRQVCLELGADMLVMAQRVADHQEGYRLLTKHLEDQSGLAKFQEFIVSQGGRSPFDRNLLPTAKYQIPVVSEQTGYVQQINAAQIGQSAVLLGAGRQFKGQQIDLSAGIVMHCRVGDYVQAGQNLATIYSNDKSKINASITMLKDAMVFSSKAVVLSRLILGFVDTHGFHSAD